MGSRVDDLVRGGGMHLAEKRLERLPDGLVQLVVAGSDEQAGGIGPVGQAGIVGKRFVDDLRDESFHAGGVFGGMGTFVGQPSVLPSWGGRLGVLEAFDDLA